MKKLLLLLIIPLLSFGQFKETGKNKHVDIEAYTNQESYKIEYTFKDHFNKEHSLIVSWNKARCDDDIDRFGIPKSMLGSYTVTEKVKRDRKKLLREGFYMKQNNILLPDQNAIVKYFREYFVSLAEYLIDILQKQNRDSAINRIEIAMKFVQDIPYGLPPETRISNNRTKKIGGIFAPHEVLIKGYGDCDSKSFLFACILSHMINLNDIIFLRGDNHLLAAVKNFKPNSYDSSFTYNSQKYYPCETAGPARLSFGKMGDGQGGSFQVYELNIK